MIFILFLYLIIIQVDENVAVWRHKGNEKPNVVTRIPFVERMDDILKTSEASS